MWKLIDDESYLKALQVILFQSFKTWDAEVLENLYTRLDNEFRMRCVFALGENAVKLFVYVCPVGDYSFQILCIVETDHTVHTQTWVQPDLYKIFQQSSEEFKKLYKGFTIQDIYNSANSQNIPDFVQKIVLEVQKKG